MHHTANVVLQFERVYIYIFSLLSVGLCATPAVNEFHLIICSVLQDRVRSKTHHTVNKEYCAKQFCASDSFNSNTVCV